MTIKSSSLSVFIIKSFFDHDQNVTLFSVSAWVNLLVIPLCFLNISELQKKKKKYKFGVIYEEPDLHFLSQWIISVMTVTEMFFSHSSMNQLS